ncbi:SPOR domain-containing protein [soil metagenome]
MDLLSVFKRGSANSASADPAPSLDTVATARKRARQRLIGATILVIIAVIGFPLVFDSAPRSVAVDVPIDIPRKEGAPPLAMPSARPSAGSASAPVTPDDGAGGAIAGADGVITEGNGEGGRELKPPVPDVRASMGQPGPPHVAHKVEKPVEKAAPKVAEKVAEKATEKPADKPVAKAADDASRARALLENKPVAKVEPAPAAAAAKPAVDTRYAIQVAAFSSEPSAQDMRSKLEKAGVKSYTQVVDTPQGKRIRVRVGPFGSRDEAERAAGKIKSAGLPSSIVPL